MNDMETGAIERLTVRRESLAAHLEGLENQIIEIGQRLSAIDETLRRLRQKAAKNERILNYGN